MQTENRLLDDLAKFMLNAAGAAQGVKEEIDSLMRQRLERWLDSMNLVPREEFDAVRAMAAEARAENLRLEARIAALEAQMAAPKKPARAKKTGA
ncbi:MAG TPA: accessory factor UbiK family protein [Alphaproteobacteria bacterium]|nr:accessory factor UbiK family protein [Alphaproteobacteria bacterium]